MRVSTVSRCNSFIQFHHPRAVLQHSAPSKHCQRGSSHSPYQSCSLPQEQRSFNYSAAMFQRCSGCPVGQARAHRPCIQKPMRSLHYGRPENIAETHYATRPCENQQGNESVIVPLTSKAMTADNDGKTPGLLKYGLM